jgi:hypothetical protein
VNEAESLGDEFFDASAGMENELNPALSAFISDVVLERLTNHTFAGKRSTDESVQESCL